MKTAIIVDNLHVCYAQYYYKEIVTGQEIETNRFNIFGEKLADLVREQKKTQVYLINGEGIKIVKNEQELMNLIQDLFLVNVEPIKVYDVSQIHTVIATI